MIQPPPWLADLPPLSHAKAEAHRSLPGPAGFFPGFPGADLNRSVALGMRRKCLFCGCDIPNGTSLCQIVWNPPKPGEYPVEYPGGLFTTPAAPAHKSCLAYSVLVCPHLHKSSRGDGAIVDWRQESRDDAAIVGWRQYGIPFFREENQENMGNPMFRFAFWDEAERVPYHTWKDMLPMYEGIVAADSEIVDVSTRLLWSNSIEDIEQLGNLSFADRATIRDLRANASTVVGGHTYQLAVI